MGVVVLPPCGLQLLAVSQGDAVSRAAQPVRLWPRVAVFTTGTHLMLRHTFSGAESGELFGHGLHYR